MQEANVIVKVYLKAVKSQQITDWIHKQLPQTLIHRLTVA